MGTGTWSDVRGVAGLTPDGVANFADINGIVAKFQVSTSAPDITRADLRSPGGQAVDVAANFADINAAVDAFSGALYPFSITACP